MTPLLVALLITGAGGLVYLLANDKFAEVGKVFLLAGAFALTFILCGIAL